MTVFQKKLVQKMDIFVHSVYKLTKNFPKEELYGAVSQLRRAALSIVLNYVEGFARRKLAVQLNFFETSYGSLKESKYLLYFSYKEGWINQVEYQNAVAMAEEMGAMLWSEITSTEQNIENKKCLSV